MSKQPTIAELNEEYKGMECLVHDPSHPDYGKKCEFVEFVRKPLERYPLAAVRIMREKRIIELKAPQIFWIVAAIPLPSVKDN